MRPAIWRGLFFGDPLQARKQQLVYFCRIRYRSRLPGSAVRMLPRMGPGLEPVLAHRVLPPICAAGRECCTSGDHLRVTCAGDRRCSVRRRSRDLSREHRLCFSIRLNLRCDRRRRVSSRPANVSSRPNRQEQWWRTKLTSVRAPAVRHRETRGDRNRDLVTGPVVIVQT